LASDEAYRLLWGAEVGECREGGTTERNELTAGTWFFVLGITQLVN